MEEENLSLDESLEEGKTDEDTLKKKSNILINVLIIVVIIIVSIVMYAKYIGTTHVSVKEYRVKSSSIPSNFSGVKIIYVSDILYGSTINTEDIEELVDKINVLRPDILLFGGGLIADGYKLDDKDKTDIINLFNKLDVKLGKYAVKGANDKELFDEIMSSSDFKIMSNSYEFIYYLDNTPICLIGVGSYVKGSFDLTTSLEFFNTNPSCYSILFTHEADIIDNILELENKPSLILAGNSLGGEINVPFYGPLFKNEGSVNYYLDYYDLKNTQVYVSSGLGTNKNGMRLFNRPSFNFFRLKS